jgi:hypothetical protein
VEAEHAQAERRTSVVAVAAASERRTRRARGTRLGVVPVFQSVFFCFRIICWRSMISLEGGNRVETHSNERWPGAHTKEELDESRPYFLGGN